MAAQEKDKRSAYISMKIQPELKEKAKERADELGRSLSNYIEWLIKEDLKKQASNS